MLLSRENDLAHSLLLLSVGSILLSFLKVVVHVHPSFLISFFMSLLKKYLLSPDSVLGSGNYKDLDKTLVKLFPNFTSIPFDYLLTSWVTNYLSNRGFLTCLSWIVSIDRELHSLKRLEQKFGLSFQNFSTTYL